MVSIYKKGEIAHVHVIGYRNQDALIVVDDTKESCGRLKYIAVDLHSDSKIDFFVFAHNLMTHVYVPGSFDNNHLGLSISKITEAVVPLFRRAGITLRTKMPSKIVFADKGYTVRFFRETRPSKTLDEPVGSLLSARRYLDAVKRDGEEKHIRFYDQIRQYRSTFRRKSLKSEYIISFQDFHPWWGGQATRSRGKLEAEFYLPIGQRMIEEALKVVRRFDDVVSNKPKTISSCYAYGFKQNNTIKKLFPGDELIEKRIQIRAGNDVQAILYLESAYAYPMLNLQMANGVFECVVGQDSSANVLDGRPF